METKKPTLAGRLFFHVRPGRGADRVFAQVPEAFKARLASRFWRRFSLRPSQP